MIITIRFSILFCAIVCFFASCKVNTFQPQPTVHLPATYLHTADSSNIAAINWRTYFSDKNLIALIDTALKNNLDLLIALQKVDVLQSDVKMARNSLFPGVTGIASGAQRKYGLYTMDGAGNISTEITEGQMVPIHLPDYYVGLQTTWEIDVWGKLRNKKKAALARYLSGLEVQNLATTIVVSETARLYYELLALDNELQIIEETILLQTKALTIVEAQKESGYVTTLAVKQFEAQLNHSRALQLQIEQAILECESAVNFLLGRLPGPISRKKEMFHVPLPANISAGIPSELLSYRPDIRQAQYELLASQADLKAAKAAFYPNLTITGAYGYQAFRTEFLFLSPQSIAYTLAGSLVAPLVNRSAIKREFRNANSNQQAAMYEYQKSILNGYIEVYNELSKLTKLGQIYQFKNRETESLKKAIEASTELYTAGRANYLEVLTSQKNALESQLELVDTKKKQHHSIINIYKALGGGWR